MLDPIRLGSRLVERQMFLEPLRQVCTGLQQIPDPLVAARSRIPRVISMFPQRFAFQRAIHLWL